MRMSLSVYLVALYVFLFVSIDGFIFFHIWLSVCMLACVSIRLPLRLPVCLGAFPSQLCGLYLYFQLASGVAASMETLDFFIGALIYGACRAGQSQIPSSCGVRFLRDLSYADDCVYICFFLLCFPKEVFTRALHKSGKIYF